MLPEERAPCSIQVGKNMPANEREGMPCRMLQHSNLTVAGQVLMEVESMLAGLLTSFLPQSLPGQLLWNCSGRAACVAYTSVHSTSLLIEWRICLLLASSDKQLSYNRPLHISDIVILSSSPCLLLMDNANCKASLDTLQGSLSSYRAGKQAASMSF